MASITVPTRNKPVRANQPDPADGVGLASAHGHDALAFDASGVGSKRGTVGLDADSTATMTAETKNVR